jgi:hypothetical protein
MPNLSELNSRITSGTTGANMDDAKGVRNVIAERMKMLRIFFFFDQFSGLAMSFGPSQYTSFGSCTASTSSVVSVVGDAFSTSSSIFTMSRLRLGLDFMLDAMGRGARSRLVVRLLVVLNGYQSP